MQGATSNKTSGGGAGARIGRGLGKGLDSVVSAGQGMLSSTQSMVRRRRYLLSNFPPLFNPPCPPLPPPPFSTLPSRLWPPIFEKDRACQARPGQAKVWQAKARQIDMHHLTESF